MSTSPIDQSADSPFHWDALRALAAATLLQAIEDITHPRGRDPAAALANQFDACIWVGRGNLDTFEVWNDNPLSDFCWVCELLGLEYTAVRAALIQQLTNQREPIPYSRRRRNLYLSVAIR